MTERLRETRNLEPGTSVADELGQLLHLVEHSDIEMLEVQHGETHFRIRRDLSNPHPTPRLEVEPHQAVQPIEGYVIASPLVGIFRRAGGASDATLEEGQEVAAGQVVGTVEAMRMQNRIQSERAGVIQDVLVRDGQPVEYGQPLLVLREP